MKIIIAPDSYKGSLSAIDVACSIKKGINNAYPHAEKVLLPVADGGEGTLETLISATNGKKKFVSVIGPLGETVNAAYGILGNNKTCVIEMASASGLDLVPEDKLSPLTTTTFGTGQLIKNALDDGFRKFIIALGGSATNDGGAGMLQALGLNVMNSEGKEIGFGGEQLANVTEIKLDSFDKRIKDSEFLIASDVENPLIGLNGATFIFGPQKGANKKEVQLLDAAMKHWADKIAEVTGVFLHNASGAGAAGGTGGAFQAFFPFEIKRGVDVVIDYIHLDKDLSDADLVITGEGKVDNQTASGKTPLGVAQAAKKRNVPTIILAGSVGEGIEELYDYGIISIHSITDKPMSLNKSVKQAEKLLERSSEQIVRTFFYHHIYKGD